MNLVIAQAREPTRKERARENSVIYSSVADLGMISLRLVFSILTGSLTLLSETVRSILMILVEINSLWLLRAIHRDRLRHFKFGIGKVEQFVQLMIGTGLVLSGFWIIGKVIESLFSEQFAPTPLGLALAAIVNAINLLINALSYHTMLAASEEKESDIFKSQLRTRGLKLSNSLLLQITMTIAALASDPVIALFMDGLGATFVACLMMLTGFSMIGESVPNLLDAPIDGTLENRMKEAISATSLSTDDLLDIRTRRSGRFPHVEVTLSASTRSSVARLKERIEEVRNAVAELGDEMDLSIVISDENDAAL